MCGTVKRRRRARLLTDTKAGIRLHFEACGNAPRKVKPPKPTSVFGQGSKDGKWADDFARTANTRQDRVAGAKIGRTVADMCDDIGTRPSFPLLG